MWSVVLITVPQVPSSNGSTSSQSMPRKPEQQGNRLIAVAPASMNAPNALVVVLGRAEANQLPLCPGAATVHRGIDATREGKLARKAEAFRDTRRRTSRSPNRAAVSRSASGSLSRICAHLRAILGAPLTLRLFKARKRELNGFLSSGDLP